MIGALFRFVLIAFLVYLAFVALRVFRLITRVRTAAPRPEARIQGAMVRDEVCNTYLPREDAIREVRDGRELFFCSERCRREACEKS
jgi:uncharacterized protein